MCIFTGEIGMCLLAGDIGMCIFTWKLARVYLLGTLCVFSPGHCHVYIHS